MSAQQPLSSRSDRKMTGSLAPARRDLDAAELSVRGVAPENGDGVVAAVGRVNIPSVGMHLDFRRGARSLPVVGECLHRLEGGERAALLVPRANGHGVIELVDHVGAFAVRRKYQMARPRPGRSGPRSRFTFGLRRRWVRAVDQHLVETEVGNQQPVSAEIDAVCVGTFLSVGPRTPSSNDARESTTGEPSVLIKAYGRGASISVICHRQHGSGRIDGQVAGTSAAGGGFA